MLSCVEDLNEKCMTDFAIKM